MLGLLPDISITIDLQLITQQVPTADPSVVPVRNDVTVS